MRHIPKQPEDSGFLRLLLPQGEGDRQTNFSSGYVFK